MKILICGKGGSGKSTVSVLTARALKKIGYSVLLVDADESNFGLHRLLGIPQPLLLMDSFGGKKGFKEKTANTFPKGSSGGLFNQKWRISDIPKDCIASSDGIALLAVGKIHDFGEGCACPIGSLSRMFLSNLEIGEKDAVVIDTEAGVEHFGRRIDAECDVILDVVDPSFESFLLAKKIQEMGQKAGAKVFFVLNKVDEQVEKIMSEQVDPARVFATIPKDNAVFTASLEGKKLTADFPEIADACRKICR
jgi:CO dehydrogenase maturation factor